MTEGMDVQKLRGRGLSEWLSGFTRFVKTGKFADAVLVF